MASNLYARIEMLQAGALSMPVTVSEERTGDAIGAVDYPRIAALYAQLYLDKYSRCNPAYRAEFLRAWHRAGLLCLNGFRDAGGELVWITGLFGVGQTLTAQIVGYDLRQPQRLALYRTLTACGFEHAPQYGR